MGIPDAQVRLNDCGLRDGDFQYVLLRYAVAPGNYKFLTPISKERAQRKQHLPLWLLFKKGWIRVLQSLSARYSRHADVQRLLFRLNRKQHWLCLERHKKTKINLTWLFFQLRRSIKVYLVLQPTSCLKIKLQMLLPAVCCPFCQWKKKKKQRVLHYLTMSFLNIHGVETPGFICSLWRRQRFAFVALLKTYISTC